MLIKLAYLCSLLFPSTSYTDNCLLGVENEIGS